MALVLTATLALAQQIREQDLSLAHITEPRIKIVGGSGAVGGMDGYGTAGQTIKVSVMDSDLARCATGEARITIQITNTSGKGMMLPWNPDGAAVVDSAQDLRYRDLAITILDPVWTDRKAYGSVLLFGASSVLNSEILIEPGETVALRNIKVAAPAEVLCSNGFMALTLLSVDKLTRVEGGYTLDSRPVWEVKSRRIKP